MIVVTGATGHVGANLVRQLLAEGKKVRAIFEKDRRGIEGLDVEAVQADVRDAAAMNKALAGAEVVFHTAARITIVDKNADEVMGINVGGVKNIVEACLAGSVGRLVHFSSIHAYGLYPRDGVVDETRGWAEGPEAGLYDRSKVGGEKEVYAGLERGLDAVIVNPTAVVGPNDFKISRVGSVILDVHNGKLPGLIEGGFSWVDARDVSAGAIAASTRGRKGEKYLLSGHWLTLLDFAKVVHEVTGGAKPPWFITPVWLARMVRPFAEGWADLTRTMPRLTVAAIRAVTNHQKISHDKATRELGYNPRPLAETIGDTYAWFKAAGLTK